MRQPVGGGQRARRAAARSRAALLAPLLAATLLCGCDGGESAPRTISTPAAGATQRVPLPPGAVACVDCHARVVAEYAGHAMADAAGPVHEPPSGSLRNPDTGTLYTWRSTPHGQTFLDLQRADGSRRTAAVIGRLGAGRHDTAFIGAQIDPVGRQTERLVFLPVEQHPDGALALAPFESEADIGFGQAAPAECLQCHTTTDLPALPAAATGPGGRVHPVAHLGTDFAPMTGLSCDACHGSTSRHVELMTRAPRPAGRDADIGLARLTEFSGPALRDICARCHLDGELRMELGSQLPYGPQHSPLHALRPTVVTGDESTPHRFAGQLERLVQSPCFRGAPQMSCNTCHDAHSSPASQGVAAFDRRCLDCHADGRASEPVAVAGRAAAEAPAAACSRPATLGVSEVSGRPARSRQGCVDCHMSSRQPLDLAGVRSVDHLVQRHLPPSDPSRPARFFADRAGDVAVFDDGRLATALATPAGRLWQDGVVAAWLFRAGRLAEAAQRLDRFPAPGTLAARTGSAPDGLSPLETSPTFHHLRGLVLAGLERHAEAEQAWNDALAIEPLHPEALAQRGTQRLRRGDAAGALADADALRAAYPLSESGSNLRARVLARQGLLDEAASALAASTELWALDAGSWKDLGQVLLMTGRREQAATALQLAAWLEPERAGLAELQAELQR